MERYREMVEHKCDLLTELLGAEVSVEEFTGPISFCIGENREQYWILINGRKRFHCDNEDELVHDLMSMWDGIRLYKEYKEGK